MATLTQSPMNLVEHSWRLQVLSIVVKPSMRLRFIFGIAAVSLSLVDTAFSGDATAPDELLWKVVESECPPDVRAAIHSVPTDNGVDTLITLTNASNKVSELPNFRLGPITVDSSSKWMDFREVGRPTQLDALGTSASATYPGLLYSPVAALITGDNMFAVSVMYPLLEFKHEVRLSLCQNQGKYYIEFGFNNPPWVASNEYRYGRLAHLSRLAPGESRSYRVSARKTTTSKGLSEAILPYVDYFHRTYGTKLEYSPRRSRISGYLMGTTDHCSADNPHGWAVEDIRPDRHGYSRIFLQLLERLSSVDRVILWGPSGLDCVDKSKNYPFNILTPLMAQQTGRGPTEVFGRATLAEPKSLGVWWGHSAEPRASWEASSVVSLSSQPEAAYELCKKELSIARALHFTTIGLDAFSHVFEPTWVLVDHLRRMRKDFPEMQFCTEGRCCDVLHRIAPTFVDAYRPPGFLQVADERVVINRFLLADALMPDHETWCAMLFDRAASLKGVSDPKSEQFFNLEIKRVQSLGYVPLVFGVTRGD